MVRYGGLWRDNVIRGLKIEDKKTGIRDELRQIYVKGSIFTSNITVLDTSL